MSWGELSSILLVKVRRNGCHSVVRLHGECAVLRDFQGPALTAAGAQGQFTLLKDLFSLAKPELCVGTTEKRRN